MTAFGRATIIRKRHWRCHGFEVTPGMEMTVRGEWGRFRFDSYAMNARTGEEWIDAFGGKPGFERWRSFHPDRVAIIHRTRKARV